MNKDEIKSIYSAMLFTKIRSITENDPQFNYINTYLPVNYSIYILDAGCGNGNYARQLAFQGYNNIFAVDLFDKVLLDNGQYVQASIDCLPYHKNVFDFIYSNSVIFYLDNPEHAIIEYS